MKRIKYENKIFQVKSDYCKKCESKKVIFKDYSKIYKISCKCSAVAIQPIEFKEVNQSYNEFLL